MKMIVAKAKGECRIPLLREERALIEESGAIAKIAEFLYARNLAKIVLLFSFS